MVQKLLHSKGITQNFEVSRLTLKGQGQGHQFQTYLRYLDDQ